MEIVRKEKNLLCLADLSSGDVFRPSNSALHYIKTELDGSDSLLSERDFDLEEGYVNLQNHNWEHYEDIILCVNLNDGEVVFFHKDITVIQPISATLEIEEID